MIAFAHCGAGVHAQVSADGQEARLVGSCCHNRFCVPCGKSRARLICGHVEPLIRKTGARFVTLTLRASDTPLPDQIDRLYRDFRLLRNKQWWKDNVKGGAAFLECKIGANSQLWHPHLHILVETPWLDQARLSREWHKVTGDSYIVDVRPADNSEQVASYVVKYVTKPASTEVFAAPNRLDEMMVATKGRRLCFTFGTWRGLCLTDELEGGTEWLEVGSINSLIVRDLDGDAEATRLLDQLERKYPGVRKLFALPPPTDDLPY